MKNFFYAIAEKIQEVVDSIVSFLTGQGEGPMPDPMQEGQLVVTGQDSIEIFLSHHPMDVEVKFLDEETGVPCDHGHKDSLEWFVHKRQTRHHHHKHNHHYHSKDYTLTIKWDVNNVRKIAWAVFY